MINELTKYTYFISYKEANNMKEITYKFNKIMIS